MATASNHNGDLDEVSSVDVVIVGAGISGLCAAYSILKTEKYHSIVVLEAKDRVGGRLDSIKLKTTHGEDAWDVGGQWIGREQKDIVELLEELKIETYKQWYDGKKIIQLSDGKLKTYSGSYPSLSYLSLIDTYYLNCKIENLCNLVPLDDPNKCIYAEEWDGMTVESWVKQQAWTQGTVEMIEIAVGCIFGVTTAQMSLLFFLHYLQTCGGWENLVESGKEGGAQEFRVKGTAHNVTKVLAERIGWNKILLRQPVVSIRQTSESIVVCTKNGLRFVAKFAIIAIPPRLTGKIDFMPRLPYDKQHTIENMIPSHLTKFIVSYPSAFWRKNGMSGEIAHITGRYHCESDPIALTFDGTTSNGSPAIIGFITSYAASKWSNKSEEKKKDAIIKSLARYLGSDAENPLDCAVKDWSEEEWNGGCPVDVMVPGAFTNYGNCLKEPFQRIHWAGTETSDVHRGYISGGVHAGYRAAREVITRLQTNK
ncbi:probable flavin-containing monoamine oxidase A [Exaiptasia diaphana]|uniref:Amine oxidase n=1 Tax=Exaiptasia diaphana TaxID=2652724 RepID=A0A913Y8Z3_EXADI|nr:probable flavin-containing monoamine oxidase A [Exaiptasia diaphana]KXJ06467.1 putative flavin-containing monoamine oxidase A [Exaiptasia diaphana]